MVDRLHETLLYDFYGDLLTEKQKLFFEMHFFSDLSLTEIAQSEGVSPQAVGDLLRRTCKLLIRYENRLNLLRNHTTQKERLEDIIVCLESIQWKAPITELTQAVSELKLFAEEL